MFEVEKPRRFHYEPRFYDPEKEKWEALKKKYAIEKEREAQAATSPKAGTDDNPEDATETADLSYFENRLRELDRQKREASSHLTWRDLFRKREMPKFEYQPRFQASARPDNAEQSTDSTELVEKYSAPKHKIKIRRRFDIADSEYMKPIPGTKIILYTGIVCLLLAVIILL